MEQQILERAQSTLESFLRQQCVDTTLAVLSVDPEVDRDGDEIFLMPLSYDDSNDAKDLPNSSALIRLKGRLHAELRDADMETCPIISFTAESEMDEEPE